MSVKALSAVFEASRADGAAFVVLLALADWADHNGWCYPSLRQIAVKARVSKSTAKRAIADLLALGELERVHRGKGPAVDDEEAGQATRLQSRNLYRIALVKPKVEVSPLPAHLAAPQVGPIPARQVGSSSAQHDPTQVSPSCAGGGFIGDAHIRNRPSVQPSVVQAGAPPRAPQKTDDKNTPEHNLGIITKLAHQVYDLLGVVADLGDVTDAVKSECARFHVAYNTDVVRKAVDSALWQRRQPRAEVR